MEKSVTMNGGDGPNSYSQNSSIQGKASALAKDLLTTSILTKLTPTSTTQIYTIADLGCSVGPNTFSSVNIIIEAVKLKYGFKSLDFQVFFNDTVSTDFNTLFRNLPSERGYMAAGVPGSFYERLFPNASIDFFHSAFALNWMSKVPDEVLKKGNQGGITYSYSEDYVMQAYRDQFFDDIQLFLEARSMEMVHDGLMAVLLPGRTDGSDPRDSTVMHIIECIGLALKEMVTEGLLEEAVVDSLHLPVYMPTLSEIRSIVSRNKNLVIEVLEETSYPHTRCSNREEARLVSLHTRAAVEGIIAQHIGNHLIDELFEKNIQKLIELSKTARFRNTEKIESLFLLARCRKS